MSVALDLQQRFAKLRELTAPIHGWLDPRSGEYLYQAALDLAPGDVVVELGSWKGLSTVWLATAVRDRARGRLYAVDTWRGTEAETLHQDLLQRYQPDQLYQEFLGNMQRCGVHEALTPMRCTTREAALDWSLGQSIGLLHIDAGHDYASVLEDFDCWSPYVMPGGIVVFDDVPSWPGPTRLITQLPHWYRWIATRPNKWVVQKSLG